MAAHNEVFRTYRGLFRILVEQVIDGRKADWYLVDRRDIGVPDGVEAHGIAASRFVGKAVNWTGERTDTGFEFVVAQ